MFLYIVFLLLSQVTSVDVYLYSDNLLYTSSAIGNLATSTATCASVRTDFYPSLQCSSTVPFLTYTTRYINQISSQLGFSDSLPVYSYLGAYISTWLEVSTDSSITDSIVSTGVIDTVGGSTFWSGTQTDGGLGFNCDDWSISTGPSGSGIGDGTLTSNTWKYSSVDTCDTSHKLICVCVRPTLAPTKQPTTAAPTKAPSKNPTKKPTNDPTKDPTKNPTTKAPTKNPTTKSPTLNPTVSPTITLNTGEVVFMAARGSQAQIQRVAGENLTYSVIDGEVNFPLNLTVKPSVNMVPVKWSNVQYRLFNPDSNTTSTETIAECNPVANPVQGTTPMGFGGLRVCPSIRKCENCSVELNPSGTTWSTLRACICTYTVTVREDIADLLSGQSYQLQTIKLKATVPNPQVISDEQFIVGELQCNSFIDRELNCQFPRYVPNYAPQCQSQPISCFNFTLGYAFGGFWDQNPKFRYDIPRANWTQAHYHGIATVLNNKTYSKNTFYIDPMVPSTFTNYFWFTNISSLDIYSRVPTVNLFIYTPEISQAEPYSYQAGPLPPPATITSTNPFSNGELGCYLFLPDGLTSFCAGLFWELIQTFIWRLPGYWEFIDVTNTEVVYSLEITANFNYSGVEIYTPRGDLCGRELRPLISQPVRISCVNAPNNTSPIDGALLVRYLGVSNFWDIPGAQLASTLPVLYDALVSWGVVSSLYSQSEFINLAYGLAYAFYVSSTGVWSGVDISAEFPHRASTTENFVKQASYVLYYGIVTETSSELTSQRDALFSLILNNNTYPRNYALEARVLSQGYDSSPVNFSSPSDLDYLYRFWGTWLAPRRCSEDTECRTFDLGRCIFPSAGPKQYWYNGDPFPDYTIPGGVQEGGCRVWDSWEKGYYSSAFFGGKCKEGYGPGSLDQWLKILQYNTTISQVVPPGYPFDLSVTPAQFESQLACKFPVGKDPLTSPFVDLNMCGGHGVVSFSTSSSTALIPFFTFKQYWLTFECTSLLIDSVEFTLNTTQTIFALQYVSPSASILTIINGAVYLDGSACTFFRLQSLPAYGVLQCGGERVDLQCVNNLYFTSLSRSFGVGILTQWEEWIVYFV